MNITNGLYVCKDCGQQHWLHEPVRDCRGETVPRPVIFGHGACDNIDNPIPWRVGELRRAYIKSRIITACRFVLTSASWALLMVAAVYAMIGFSLGWPIELFRSANARRAALTTTNRAIDSYANELVCYGGEWITRAEMIAHLTAIARSRGRNAQTLVRRYLQGFEIKTRLR